MTVLRCDGCGKDKVPPTKEERGNLVYRAPWIKLSRGDTVLDFCNVACLDKKLESFDQWSMDKIFG